MHSSINSYLYISRLGNCFTYILRALKDILLKLVYCRNRISNENFKLKPCMCAHDFGTHTKFQLEILTMNVISGIVYFQKILFWRATETNPGDAYMDQWTGSSLVQIMVGCLFGTKPLLNLLWHGDAIWWHGTRSTLAQITACCLTAPSHYLN